MHQDLSPLLIQGQTWQHFLFDKRARLASPLPSEISITIFTAFDRIVLRFKRITQNAMAKAVWMNGGHIHQLCK